MSTQDSRHRRHRLSRRRQDQPDPAPAAQRRRPALALIINEFGEIGVDGELLLGCGDRGLPRGRHRRAGQWLHLLHRRRRFPADHARRCSTGPTRPSTSSSRPRAWRCRSRWCKAFNWPEVRTRVTVDGVIAVVDAAGGGGRPLRRRSGGGRRAARRRSGAGPRQPARGAVRGPARLRRPGRAQQDRPLVDAARAAIELRADRAPQLRPASSVVPASFGAIDPAVLLGLGAAAEDDLDSRPSHHELARRGPRPRRFRQLRRRPAARSTTPETLVARLLPAIAAPRHPAGQGLPRRRRQGRCAWCVQGVGAAHRSTTTTAPGRRTRTRARALVVIGRKGLDRAAHRPRRCGGLSRMHLLAATAGRRSPTAARPSISARRRATSSSCRRPTPSWPASPRAQARRRRRRRRALRSPTCCSSAHHLSVDLYVEQVIGRRAAGRRAAARRRAATGPTASSRSSATCRATRHPAGAACRATTSPIRSCASSRPCRPAAAHRLLAVPACRAASRTRASLLRYAAQR